MDSLKAIWILLAAVLSNVIPGCLAHYSWHQKVTIEVETPEGIRTGSSIVAVRWDENDDLTKVNAQDYRSKVRGEAPFVEVKPGAYLFAILRGAAFLAPCTFVGGAPISSHGGLLVNYGLIEQTGPELERTREARTVPEECMPVLVTFGDVDDPASVKRVDPEDLPAAFGEGYALKRISVSTTNEEVTSENIERVLPWLREVGIRRATLIPDPPFLRKDATDPDIQDLTPGGFSTELYR